MRPRPAPIAAALALCWVGACAGADADRTETAPPEWFATRSAELDSEGFPELARAPATTRAKLDPEHWDRVQADLAAAEAAMRADPRSTGPSDAPDAVAFEQDARAAIDATRESH
ncbi:MAG: hypothetical protein GC189_01535 [Alphaproteobacteria bacterium]|nr:hypothetical protein [Alphaproteobacteria bacterium]